MFSQPTTQLLIFRKIFVRIVYKYHLLYIIKKILLNDNS